MMQNDGKSRKINFFCKIADFSAFFTSQSRYFVVKSYRKKKYGMGNPEIHDRKVVLLRL